MRLMTFAVLLTTLGAPTVAAQVRPGTGGSKPQPAAPRTALPAPGPWSVSFGMTSIYDSNIDHSSTPASAFGEVASGGAEYRRALGGGSWTTGYEAGLHRYMLSPTQSSEWNRLSHHLESAFERRLNKRWTTEMRAEVSVRGSSSDDRELFNQFALEPRAELRLNQRDRVRFVAAYRIRQYDSSSARSAVAPYVGAEFRQKFDGGRAWNAGLRYERFAANDARYSYNRWMYALGLDTPLSARDRLELDLKFRSQSYTTRIVTTTAGVDELRHDNRWFPSASLIHAIRPELTLRGDYRLEGRTSNDVGKDFQAHRVMLGINWRW